SATLQKVATPGASSIEAVSKMLGCRPSQMIKTLVYAADGKPVAVLLRGDHEANEGKIRRALGAARLEMASAEMVQQATGAPVGFAGPVGLEVAMWADHDVAAMVDAVTGANEGDMHLTGVNQPRDFKAAQFGDLRNAEAGDPCPHCE